MQLSVANEALMFNEDAAILDHRHTGVQGPFAGEFIPHAKLHPDRFRPVGNRFLDDGRYFVRLPKDVHNIDLAPDLTERGNCRHSKCLVDPWIYWNDGIAVRLHVATDPV